MPNTSVLLQIRETDYTAVPVHRGAWYRPPLHPLRRVLVTTITSITIRQSSVLCFSNKPIQSLSLSNSGTASPLALSQTLHYSLRNCIYTHTRGQRPLQYSANKAPQRLAFGILYSSQPSAQLEHHISSKNGQGRRLYQPLQDHPGPGGRPGLQRSGQAQGPADRSHRAADPRCRGLEAICCGVLGIDALARGGKHARGSRHDDARAGAQGSERDIPVQRQAKPRGRVDGKNSTVLRRHATKRRDRQRPRSSQTQAGLHPNHLGPGHDPTRPGPDEPASRVPQRQNQGQGQHHARPPHAVRPHERSQ